MNSRAEGWKCTLVNDYIKSPGKNGFIVEIHELGIFSLFPKFQMQFPLIKHTFLIIFWYFLVMRHLVNDPVNASLKIWMNCVKALVHNLSLKHKPC